MPHPDALPSPKAIMCFTGGFTATNGYVFATSEGWVGVDAPADFAPWLNQQGILLKALLLTHAHFDHVLDAARIAREHQCPVYAWEMSTSESRLETYLLNMAGMKLEVEPYPVDYLLEGCSSVNVCGQILEVAHVPGHSHDSVVFYDPNCRRAFTGDTLMAGTIGRTDFPGGGMALLIGGIRSELMVLGDDVAIHPGHGESSTIGAERWWIDRFDGSG